MAKATTNTKTTTNRAEIRRWVESKGGCPARVKGTERGNDPGLLRIDFPGYGGVERLTKMSWDEWFKWFDKKRLALQHQPSTRVSKLISRDTMTIATSRRATPRRTTGAKRATTAKRTGAKRTTKKPSTRLTVRRSATLSRGGATIKRTTTAKRGAVKRTKRPATKRTKRTTARRTSR